MVQHTDVEDSQSESTNDRQPAARTVDLDVFAREPRAEAVRRVVCHVDMDCFYCEKRSFPDGSPIED